MKPGSRQFYRLTKPLVFLMASLPLVWVTAGAFGLAGIRLGANPVEAIMDVLGVWGLRILLVTLAVTPLQNLTGWRWLLGYRRMLGLFVFTYVLLHFLTYAILDQGLDLNRIFEDVLKRPYITIGFTALLMLVPLAVTSTRGWMRRLGPRWKRLHKLVYVIAVLGVWHFYWQVKLDTVEPLVYAIILTVLLGYRWYLARAKDRRQAARQMAREGLRENQPES